MTSSKHNIKGYEEYPFAAYLREMKEKGWPTSADEKSWKNKTKQWHQSVRMLANPMSNNKQRASKQQIILQNFDQQLL